jgi:peptidoglycan/xylan/chitin deacetylase (PgdA/CDA1 family)
VYIAAALRLRPSAVIAAVALLLAVVPAAGATGPTGPTGARKVPLPIIAASLVQDGQRVNWSVQLGRPFSPSGLERHGETLCLLLAQPARGQPTGQICVAPARRGSSHPRLVYNRITRGRVGPSVSLPATVTRESDAQLTASFVPTMAGIRYAHVAWQVKSTLAAPACVPPAPTPPTAGCSTVFPAKPRAASLHTPKLAGCVAAGPEWVFNGPTNRRQIALTFDDGPWYDTEQFLGILEREHVVATFFEIGRQIATFGQGGAIERRMLADGDMIGDHTWSHPDVAGGGAFAAQQISITAAAIQRATGGFEPCLFRAPYGAVSPALLATARSLGFTTVQWDIDPRDWALPGVSAIYSNVIVNAHNGAIIIQHDGGGNRSETLAALPIEIDTLRREGFQFVTVTQMLGYTLIYK